MANVEFLNHIILSSRTLTVALKNNYFEKICKRDGGFVCFYCKIKLEFGKFVYEHLNDDRSDNRMENIVFACYSCNNTKTTNDSMKKNALAKLKENERNVLSVREFEEDETASIEINLNGIGLKMTEEFLEEKFQESDSIDKIDARRCIALRMYNKTGNGSEVTIDRHLKMLCCSEGKYEQVGKKIVRSQNVESKNENVVNHKDTTILSKTTNLSAVELNIIPEIEPENRHKIDELSKILHDEEKCEACEIVVEYKKRTEILRAIYHKSSSKEKENLDPDVYSTVGHCTSFFCNEPTFDGDHWCGRCVNFWSKIMYYPKEGKVIGV